MVLVALYNCLLGLLELSQVGLGLHEDDFSCTSYPMTRKVGLLFFLMKNVRVVESYYCAEISLPDAKSSLIIVISG